LSQVDLDGKITILGFFGVSCSPEAVEVYPNPAKEHFTLVGPSSQGKRTMRLLSTQGEVLLQQEIDFDLDPSWQFSLAELASGMYLIELSNDAESQTIRLIKE
jgi:hypothetical protein